MVTGVTKTGDGFGLPARCGARRPPVRSGPPGAPAGCAPGPPGIYAVTGRCRKGGHRPTAPRPDTAGALLPRQPVYGSGRAPAHPKAREGAAGVSAAAVPPATGSAGGHAARGGHRPRRPGSVRGCGCFFRPGGAASARAVAATPPGSTPTGVKMPFGWPESQAGRAPPAGARCAGSRRTRCGGTPRCRRGRPCTVPSGGVPPPGTCGIMPVPGFARPGGRVRRAPDRGRTRRWG